MYFLSTFSAVTSSSNASFSCAGGLLVATSRGAPSIASPPSLWSGRSSDDHLFSGERVAGGSLEDDSVVAEKDGAFGWEQRRTSQQTGTATDGTALFSSVGEKVHAQPL
ncbi:hypothetical protein GEV33_000856 [Tenebrio molitor]|jgi:hypothetical protein|uniref:Uncharacterized protein n=1 Tax=Tenebrio molitor TaxID=7067 RepID=A0A8J6HNG1_TENMO|nr:hypothetical protein GEV33_000856 [Tenebrio molitor]